MIKINNLIKEYNGTKVLKNISINFEKNKMISIMGPSGAGKSTLLNVLSGIEPVTSGSIQINNINMSTMSEHKINKFRLKNLSVIFSDYKLVDHLTLKENVELLATLRKQKIDKVKYQDLISRIGLAEHDKKRSTKLSSGQQQRTAIARAIMSGTNLILADEPTSALDIKTRNNILNIFREWVQNNNTLVAITHDPFFAFSCDEIYFIYNGQIVDVLKNPKTPTEVTEKLVGLEKIYG